MSRVFFVSLARVQAAQLSVMRDWGAQVALSRISCWAAQGAVVGDWRLLAVWWAQALPKATHQAKG
jgi:hypothetical protein